MAVTEEYSENNVHEAGAWKAVSHKKVRHALDEIYVDQLTVITLVMTGYYLFTTLSHWFFLDGAIRIPVTLMALIALLTSGITHCLARFKKIPARYSHVALIPAGVMALALVYLHVGLSGDIHQITNGVLMLLAFGFITLLPHVFIFLTGISILLYINCLVSMGVEHTAHYAFMGVAGLLLSILCFFQRYRTLSNVERLLISNRDKSRALAAKVREARHLFEEAQQAAEAAQRANEAKSVFLSNTTHELRTPMTGVLGMIRLLDKTRLDHEQKELLGAAKFSAKSLLTLINDILDLARMEEGKLELQVTPFHVEEVVRQIVDLLRPAADEKGLALFLKLPEQSFPAVAGDSVRIGQVLFNLIGNAIKFTENGRIDVRLSIFDANLDRCTIEFEVRDTGIGFDSEDIGRLFARFEQVDGSKGKKQAGTGLGLAISRELVSMMGGTLEAEGERGKGACFKFRIQLPIATEAVEFDTDNVATLEKELSPTLPSMKVLVAEDNPVNQMLIKKMLSVEPWELTIVEDGLKAKTEVLDNEYDLVLMDVRMPVMDGVEATCLIRSAEGARAQTPIIAVTANTMEEDLRAYAAAGMDGVVGKPIQMSELRQAVRSVLGKRQV